MEIKLLKCKQKDSWEFKSKHNLLTTIAILAVLAFSFLFVVYIFYNIYYGVITLDIYSKCQEGVTRVSLAATIGSNSSFNTSKSNDVETLQEKKNEEKIISCYYNSPSNFTDPMQLQPFAIQPHLCTHINLAFAKVRNNKLHLGHNIIKAALALLELKNVNPQLKLLLSVGGGGGDGGFPDMVANHENRKEFIRSIKSFLRIYKFDGIDLDWEFPGINNLQLNVKSRQRQHFSQLLHEIRLEYIRERKNYLLTVAAAAPVFIIDASYDIFELNSFTDFVNIMTYDFHYYSPLTPFTGLNSPVYPRDAEHAYFRLLNINATVAAYMMRGLSPEKIVVGIPTYGHSFRLVNPKNTEIGSPAMSHGSLGYRGYVNYPDICQFLHEYRTEVTVESEKEAKVPYMFYKSEWVSYEDKESVKEKAKYIKQNRLRGAMIYALNSDDYLGMCGLQDPKFPLMHAIQDILID